MPLKNSWDDPERTEPRRKCPAGTPTSREIGRADGPRAFLLLVQESCSQDVSRSAALFELLIHYNSE
jgi:hypothetical protein